MTHLLVDNMHRNMLHDVINRNKLFQIFNTNQFDENLARCLRSGNKLEKGKTDCDPSNSLIEYLTITHIRIWIQHSISAFLSNRQTDRQQS